MATCTLKARLTALFSPSLGECLQTSKELRKQIRDRVLQMVEDEVQLRVGGDAKWKGRDRDLGEQYGISRPGSVLEVGGECKECRVLRKERDEAVGSMGDLQMLVDKYKQQIVQLKEISKHHRSIAEGTLRLSADVAHNAAVLHDGVSRSDVLQKREELLVANHRRMHSSLTEALAKLEAAQRDRECLQAEVQSKSEMVDALKRELEVAAHTVVVHRRQVQELEARQAQARVDGEGLWQAGRERREDPLMVVESQQRELMERCWEQLGVREVVERRDRRIGESESELESVRQEAGQIARGVGDELAKLRKQTEQLQKVNSVMASEMEHLHEQLRQATIKEKYTLDQRDHECAKTDVSSLKWQLASLLAEVASMRDHLLRTKRLQLEEISLCKAHFALKIHTLRLQMTPTSKSNTFSSTRLFGKDKPSALEEQKENLRTFG